MTVIVKINLTAAYSFGGSTGGASGIGAGAGTTSFSSVIGIGAGSGSCTGGATSCSGGVALLAGTTESGATFLGVNTVDFAVALRLGVTVSIPPLASGGERVAATGKVSFAIGATAGTTGLLAGGEGVVGKLLTGANAFGLNVTALWPA